MDFKMRNSHRHCFHDTDIVISVIIIVIGVIIIAVIVSLHSKFFSVIVSASLKFSSLFSYDLF